MNLFNQNNEHISKSEMENYLNNSLSDKEKNSLETAMQNDPFLADAMEGYAQFPSEINNIPKYKKGTKKFYFLVISLVFILVLGLVYLFNNQITISKFTPRENNLSYLYKVEKETIQKTDLIEEDIVTEEQIITPTTANNNIKKEEKIVPFVRETVSLEKYQAEPEIYQQELNYDIKKMKVKTISFYNFLAVDYSVIYIDETPFEEIEVGTPASQSNSETYNLTDENRIDKTIKFTYKEYLKKSLKLLSEQQYGNAITNFNTILKHYPNDVNAQFYSGFSYYNLKKYPEAISFFDKVMNNSFDFFYEDAQWYKALSFEQNGRFKEANRLFRVIASEKGFYSTQAAKK